MAYEKSQCRWYRIGLWVLLLLMILVAIGESLVVARMWAAGRQRDAVAAIQKSGGEVCYCYERPVSDSSFYDIQHAGNPPGPWWLRRLLGGDFFSTVVEACVERDADIEYVKQLDQLERLICRPEVTEAGLDRLKELPRLRNLALTMNLEGGRFAMDRITALTDLEQLSLYGTRIGDDELERLKTMPKLRFLGLGDTKITDAGLRHLAGLAQLEDICLNRTQIGDAGVEHLKVLKQLKRLRLSETRITDAALEHLSGLKHLVRLEVLFTNVTTEGVRKIAKALPGCDVAATVPDWPTIDPFATP